MINHVLQYSEGHLITRDTSPCLYISMMVYPVALFYTTAPLTHCHHSCRGKNAGQNNAQLELYQSYVSSNFAGENQGGSNYYGFTANSFGKQWQCNLMLVSLTTVVPRQFNANLHHCPGNTPKISCSLTERVEV